MNRKVKEHIDRMAEAAADGLEDSMLNDLAEEFSLQEAEDNVASVMYDYYTRQLIKNLQDRIK